MVFAFPTIYIDPYFHYHAPLEFYQYPIYNAWYQNDGIARNFAYDAVITGTSMTENFKTSELDELFGTTSVKIPYSGASYLQINTLLEQALRHTPNVKMVLRGLDMNRIGDEVTAIRSDVPFPEYLYNDNPFDDVNYILNKSIFTGATLYTINYTKTGNMTTSFDTYANWMSDEFTFGRKSFDQFYDSFTTMGNVVNDQSYSGVEYEMMQSNINQNVISLARDYPDTVFYYFITPYSIVHFGQLKSVGTLKKQIDFQRAATELILENDNIKLFSFLDEYELITNLDNYKDPSHYGEWVNTMILNWMNNDEHLLTKTTYSAYYDEIFEFYNNFDYASIYD